MDRAWGIKVSQSRAGLGRSRLAMSCWQTSTRTVLSLSVMMNETVPEGDADSTLHNRQLWDTKFEIGDG